MKKQIILKKLFIVSMFAVALFSVILKTTAAVNVDFTTSDTVKESTLVKSKTLSEDITYNVYKTVAYNNGIINENNTNDFTVSYLESSSTSSRVVNWSSTSIMKWSGQKVTTLMKDYDEKNPKYLAIGAINGDFFHIQSTCEVMNVSMQEGELYKPYQWKALATGVIGFKADGTIVAGTPWDSSTNNTSPKISDQMYLEVLDGDEVKLEKVITTVNKAPSSTGITLLTPDMLDETYDLTDYTVVKLKYTTYRFSLDGNSDNSRLFVKGNVVEVSNTETSVSKLPDFDVYLVAKDDSLNEISVGDNLRMQYHLEGEWSDVVNCAGYHDQILKDGKSLFYQAVKSSYAGLVTDTDYINCSKNRTIVGQKEDGSIIFMTIEYNKNSTKSTLGASYYECAEYLRTLGCVNGWLLDGGGSTTMAIKDNDTIKMVAGGSDGSERADGNALLLVVKNPGVNVVIDDKNHASLSFHLEKNSGYGLNNVSNYKLTLNNETISCEIGKSYSFDNLNDNTEYLLKLSYDIDGKTESIDKYYSTISYRSPKVEITSIGISDDAIQIVPQIKKIQENTDISDVSIKINNQEYEVTDGEPLIITGLEPNTKYEITYSLKSKDACTGKIYEVTDELLEENVVTTVDISVPFITEFKINELTSDTCSLSYAYYDPKNVVTKAYVEYFGIKEEVELSPSGTYTVEGVDAEGDEYIFKLVLEYPEGIVQSAEVSTSGVEITEVTPVKEGCAKASVLPLVLSIILMGYLLIIIKKNR